MKLNGIVKISLLSSLVLLGGCRTRDVGSEYVSEVTLKEYNQDYFREMIRDERFRSAFINYYSLYPQGQEGEGWDSIRRELASGMSGEFHAAWEENDYGSALSLYNSLERTGNLSPDEPRREDLNYEYLQYLMEEEFAGAAACWFLEHRETLALDRERRATLESYFLESRLSTPLETVTTLQREAGEEPGQESTAFLKTAPEKKDMLDGTATVWVNRGIRLENGVGTPDRVIGSGFFIDPKGYLLTNYHVISSEVDPTYEGYSRLYVKLNENESERIPAVVVGWDPVLDLALLKVEITPPYVFSFAGDDDYSLGDSIFAIGSPGGLSNTVTSGTISNLGRELQAIGDSLQVDVPINPGNSGGPLLNQKGEAIGIVYAGVEDYEGVNFAIPASYVKELLPRLYEGGKVEYGWMGFVGYKEFGKIINRYIVPGTAAELSSLRLDDRIVGVNGRPVEDIKDIQNSLISSYPGEIVYLDIIRSGQEISLPVGIEARPDYPMKALLNRDSLDNLFAPLFGMRTVRINKGRSFRQYRLEEVFPGSVADEAGLVRGDSFTLNRWVDNEEERVLVILIVIKARKSGFMQSGLQLGLWYDMNYFL
ncbi:MAG: trypsin-like peptidase domain-containing protein [Spirochaetales bacterium]|nr:trypsin-like peptidase domain-containing protein [Spirochaetales bacterium]